MRTGGTIFGVVLWASLPGSIAKKKGYSFLAFFLLSLIITPLITTIITLCLKNQNKADEVGYSGQRVNTVPTTSPKPVLPENSSQTTVTEIVNTPLITETRSRPVNCSVTFVDGLGKTIYSTTVPYGGSVSAPRGPETDGYLFRGWDSELSCITSDTVVHPVLVRTGDNYRITYMDMDYSVIATKVVSRG